jgi:hypothetical protein
VFEAAMKTAQERAAELVTIRPYGETHPTIRVVSIDGNVICDCDSDADALEEVGWIRTAIATAIEAAVTEARRACARLAADRGEESYVAVKIASDILDRGDP